MSSAPTLSEMPALRILLVEDNDGLRDGLELALRERFGSVLTYARGDEAIEYIESGDAACDVVVSDLRLPGADGRAVLRSVRAHWPDAKSILITAYGKVGTAVAAMREGAFDFIEKPFELSALERRVAEAAAGRFPVLEDERAAEGARSLSLGVLGASAVVAESAAMREALAMARRAAPARSTVLITGETGTGKEVVASLIHEASPRAGRAFVKVNCAALPETLLESELFGHERGAFTGADRQRIGRFEQASGGTLFLDEIGDLSHATQAKLLRVLQDQDFHRLGGTRSLRTDARIVAATNRDLGERMQQGHFREDLFYRLNVIGIHLVPLRERSEDALALARHFLAELSGGLPAREGADPNAVWEFGQDAVEAIRDHVWLGNVRELRNAVERAVLMSDRTILSAQDLALPAGVGLGSAGTLPAPTVAAGDLRLAEHERELVLAALRQTDFVQRAAAERLGVSSRKLNYMIDRMGITHPSWRRHRGPVPARERGE